MEKIENTNTNENEHTVNNQEKKENMIFPILIKNTIQVKLFQNMNLIEKNLKFYQ